MLTPLDDGTWITRALPIIVEAREKRLGWGKLVAALYEDRLIVSHLRSTKSLAETVYHPDGADTLLKQATFGSPKELALSAVVAATVQPTSILTRDSVPTVTFHLKGSGGDISFEVPTTAAAQLAYGLHILLGDRFSWPNPLPSWLADLSVPNLSSPHRQSTSNAS